MASSPNLPKVSEILAKLDKDASRTYELDLRNGIMKADGPEDHERMMHAIEKIGQLNLLMPKDEVSQQTVAPVTPPPPAILKSPTLTKVADEWLAERKRKNAPRTVYAKERHYLDFAERVAADIEINSVTKSTVVGYKSALLTAGQKGKTIDNKLLSLHDLFSYAIANGAYTISNENPVSGLYVLTKKERVQKNEPYQQFTRAELAKIFEPAIYKEWMDVPDLFWGPLIGLYTGMRISEVAQIRCQDIGISEGDPYLFVHRSKTSSGVRNLPIAKDLIDLGLLDYVAEVSAAGAERLFPHRPFVNGTYGKRLGEVFGEYLKHLKLKRPQLSFHSFRATVVTEMANADVPLWKSMKLAGHSTTGGPGNMSMQVHFGYIRDLPELRPIVDAFDWQLKLSALKYDGRFKEFVGNQKNWRPGENDILGGS